MNKFDLEQIEIELNNKKSFTDRLEYWQNIINEYFEKPLIKKFEKYEGTFEQRLAIDKLKTELFGTDYTLITQLLIPENIYNKNFKDGLKTPEFTYWFLKYNAKLYFETSLKKNFLITDKQDIESELKRINDFEAKALDFRTKETNLYQTSTFNLSKDYTFSGHNKEAEFLRIKKDYYKNHVCTSANDPLSTVVILYAVHIYLKQYLEKLLLPKYNFNSWLNDKINKKIFINNKWQKENHIVSNWGVTMVDKGLISKQDYEKIKKAQIEAYNKAVELSTKSMILGYKKSLITSPDKQALYNLELERINEILNKDKNELLNILRGEKDYSKITGKQCSDILLQYDKFNSGKLVFVFIALNDNMRLTALDNYKEWLLANTNNKDFFSKHFEIELKNILEKQNKLIPKVPIKDVYEHFKVLTEETNKNDEFYLTQKQLLTFIKATFIDNKPIKQEWNCKAFKKKDVRKIFYNFYFYYKKYEKNNKKVKQKYFDILNNSFYGFNKNDYDDFHKT